MSWYQIMGHKGPVLKVLVHRDRKGSNPIANQLISQSMGKKVIFSVEVSIDRIAWVFMKLF